VKHKYKGLDHGTVKWGRGSLHEKGEIIKWDAAEEVGGWEKQGWCYAEIIKALVEPEKAYKKSD